MSDLIFVPELGLISSLPHISKLKTFCPKPFLVKPRPYISHRIRRKLKQSPFVKTQRISPLNLRFQSEKRSKPKFQPSSLEINLLQRPGTMASTKNSHPINFLNWLNEDKLDFSALDNELNLRPSTMSMKTRTQFKKLS
jgi:hypothetical protein